MGSQAERDAIMAEFRELANKSFFARAALGIGPPPVTLCQGVDLRQSPMNNVALLGTVLVGEMVQSDVGKKPDDGSDASDDFKDYDVEDDMDDSNETDGSDDTEDFEDYDEEDVRELKFVVAKGAKDPTDILVKVEQPEDGELLIKVEQAQEDEQMDQN